MYGNEFDSDTACSAAIYRSAERNVHFLEMALPGLCMTCARMDIRDRQSSVIDPFCTICMHDSPRALGPWIPTANIWRGNPMVRKGESIIQKRFSMSSWGSRPSIDSYFAPMSADADISVEDNVNEHRYETSELEWPDWSPWLNNDSWTPRHEHRFSRASLDSTGTALTTDSSDLSDDETLLSSPNPKSNEPVKEHAPSPVEIVKPTPISVPLQPAKTGFALWVGNISPKSTLADLQKLFGTPDLQSIYLIQRTGCAFVNYNNAEALRFATQLFETRGRKLHDHELVIKTQLSDATAMSCTSTASADSIPASVSSALVSPDRFFICKSLTVEDLEHAKETQQWSTQLRNRERFNEAFSRANNTYLVFSANRTSAFYGIAKLEEEFTEPAEHELSVCSCNGSCEETCLPEITATSGYEHPEDGVFIPAGETVFDPLRGSQFWKVEGCACVEPETEKWTNPARITWISSARSIIPFARTKNLKNSLNSNKPLKVARDGTEIDPEIGRKLFQMFCETQ